MNEDRSRVALQGYCDARFEKVRQAFQLNFDQDDEVGASVAIHYRGRLVVDLWGGFCDAAKTRPWMEDTVVCTMSVVKAFSALCIHQLIGRGELSLEQPVAKFWPEFAAEGKSEITLRWVMCHLSGIPVADLANRGEIYDWDAMTHAIAVQKPLWTPGTTRCYHSSTQGFIFGELIRRITGCSIGDYLSEFVMSPLGIDFHLGLSKDIQLRCADLLLSPGTVFDAALRKDRSTILGRGWYPISDEEDFNSVRWRESLIPSANGHGNARAIAKLYGALSQGGISNQTRVIDENCLNQAITEQWRGESISSKIQFRTALGFFLSYPPDRPMGPNLRTFGHSGAGGAQGFADPDALIGFGYSPNKMHGGTDIGIRATRLINACYRSYADIG